MTAVRKFSEHMTIDEFLAFTGSRPDEEHWELIEGVPRMNASPTDWHQMIAGNIFFALRLGAETSNASWLPLMGIGTRVPASPHSLPTPDLQVLAAPLGAMPQPTTSESLVLFEILSKSNTKADQAWRKRVYASIPNLQHYVTVSQKAALVVRYDRADAWSGVEISGISAKLALPVLGKAGTLSLKDIYRSTAVR